MFSSHRKEERKEKYTNKQAITITIICKSTSKNQQVNTSTTTNVTKQAN